jgi:phospholipid-binding lipoprotein MlaA
MRIRAITAATAAVLLLADCATLPNGKPAKGDPFERVNRSIYSFNSAADRAVFRPIARGWKAAVPTPIRHGLSNFISNLAYPGTIINDLLQGKFTQGGHDFTRLLINTVFGFGFFDPATTAGLERHDEDIGQTLGKWGVPAGPYIMLPIFGPSSVRDAPARLADEYTDGRHYLPNQYVRLGIWTTEKLELRASLLPLDNVVDNSFDPYAFVRNAWVQSREYKVNDGAVTDASADLDTDAGAEPPAN